MWFVCGLVCDVVRFVLWWCCMLCVILINVSVWFLRELLCALVWFGLLCGAVCLCRVVRLCACLCLIACFV